eukprot:s429_g9.t1
MAALNGGVLPALATQIGHWECDVGTGDCSSSSSWVDFHWPVSSILEQAFCRGKSSVDFIRGGNQYQVVFDTDLPGRLKDLRAHITDASMDSPSTASQVNLKTKVKRTVRRFLSQAGKSQYLQREVERQSLSWSNWIGVSFTWLLEPPVVGTCAAHPKGDPCNFALERLMPDARCEQAAEWSILQQLWQNRGRRSRLLAAFRVQNRGNLALLLELSVVLCAKVSGLITSFVAQEQAMRKRLALGTDFVDGSPRVELLWHGTRSQSSLLDICRDGFDRAHASSCMYGKGCYFATSGTYSDKTDGGKNVRAMLLAAVLVGECAVGTSNMYPAPRKPHSVSGERYESLGCSKARRPKAFVVSASADSDREIHISLEASPDSAGGQDNLSFFSACGELEGGMGDGESALPKPRILVESFELGYEASTRTPSPSWSIRSMFGGRDVAHDDGGFDSFCRRHGTLSFEKLEDGTPCDCFTISGCGSADVASFRQKPDAGQASPRPSASRVGVFESEAHRERLGDLLAPFEDLAQRNYEVVRMLVIAKANPRRKTSKMRSALDFAQEAAHTDTQPI